MCQVLPCSSGSSELWFACKVFTGEEVVIKRVVENKGGAFDRERAVLKVGVLADDRNQRISVATTKFQRYCK